MTITTAWRQHSTSCANTALSVGAAQHHSDISQLAALNLTSSCAGALKLTAG